MFFYDPIIGNFTVEQLKEVVPNLTDLNFYYETLALEDLQIVFGIIKENKQIQSLNFFSPYQMAGEKILPKKNVVETIIKFVQEYPLTSLRISGGLIQDDEIKLLANCLSLTALNVFNNDYTEEGLTYLIRHSKLKKLSINEISLSKEFFEVMSGEKKLISLIYTDCCINSVAINALSLNSTITELVLERANLDEDDVNMIAKNQIIRKLSVAHNNIYKRGALAFAENETLTSLNLSHNKIDFDGISLRLPITPITYEISKMDILAALARCKNLTSLDISNNQIGFGSHIGYSDTQKELSGITALSKHPKLVSLNISQNRFNDESIEILAKNRSLTYLEMSSCHITDISAIALAKHPRLMKLNIECAKKLTIDFAKALIENTTLTSLKFLGGNVTSLGEDAIEIIFKVISRNSSYFSQKRGEIIYILSILACNQASDNCWSRMPKELKLHILSFVDFNSPSTHLLREQTCECAKFIFNNIDSVKKLFSQGRGVKLKQKQSDNEYYFSFFQSTNKRKIKEGEDLGLRTTKIRKLF